MSEDELQQRANRVLLETRTGFKNLFIERTPVDILSRTVELAESSVLAGRSVAHFISSHTFRFYLKREVKNAGRVELTAIDRDFIEYALEMIGFAVAIAGEVKDAISLAVHEHVLTMIYDINDELVHIPSVTDRIRRGKALCLIAWVNRNYYNRAHATDEELSYLPYIIENMDRIEPRVRIIAERGSARPEDIEALLDAHPAIGDGAL